MASLFERLSSHQAASTSYTQSPQPAVPLMVTCRGHRGSTAARRQAVAAGLHARVQHTVGPPRASALVTRSIGRTAQDQNGSTSPAKRLDYATGVQPCAPCLDGPVQVEVNESQVVTKFIAETLLPTRQGLFRLRGYKHSIDGGLSFTEPTAIICGDVEGRENVPVRVHDACFTSEVLGSMKCDCAEQLSLSLELIRKSPPGMVIYLQQEGRGIGLANKIAAYSLQEQGLDTVDANRALGLPDDCREYTSVKNIMKDLNIKSIQLITNNPRKISELEKLDICITGRIPCIVQAGEHNQNYLDTKRERMDHMLEGQWCFWNHDGEPSQPTASSQALGGFGLPGQVRQAKDGRVVPLPGFHPIHGTHSSSN